MKSISLPMSKIIIREITVNSKLLDYVIDLADQNAGTLGFLPRQAFYEHASKKLILVAVNQDNELMGYLLYRIVRNQNKVTIVHLCIDNEYRGLGVSHKLFDKLREITSAYYGIGLWCRRDYQHANKMWNKLGFRPKYDKRGRGKVETTLTYWWYDNGFPTLFDVIGLDKLQVIIDANIFFEFQNPKQAMPETLALQADWLQDELELKITQELFNEINRQTNKHLRKRNWDAANIYPKAQDSNNQLDEVINSLHLVFPSINRPNDLSDIKQVAWAIVDSEVDFFITRDEGILNLTDLIYDKFDLRILRPVDLILHIDEYIRIKEYTNMRFSGTQFSLRRIQSREEQRLVTSFQYDDHGERRSAFLSSLRPFLINVDETDCYVVEDNEKNFLALFVYDRSQKDELRIPIFRVNRKIIDKKMVRHILFKFLTISSGESRDFTRITEKILHNVIKRALQEDAFFPSGDSWLKANLPIIGTAQYVAKYLEAKLAEKNEAMAYYRMQVQNLRDINSVKNVKTMSEIERLLWPAKVIDTMISTITLSIDADWANRWFDDDLASQTLFGAQAERAFNREGVYYSRKPLKSIDLPARILWYVKKDSRLLGTESIRACSRLEEITVGSAKDIFRQYQHLGIYEWKNIENLTKGDPQVQIAAYRFSDTQLFKKPIPYTQWEKFTKSLSDKQPNRQSPARVPPEIFIQIYRIGMDIYD